MTESKLSVRLLTLEDIDKIIDYFYDLNNVDLIAMGVDRAKIPQRNKWYEIIKTNFLLNNMQKDLFYVIWMKNDEAIGHCNINNIRYNQDAYMHLHLWHRDKRQMGYGIDLVRKSVSIFFSTFGLLNLYCQPYVLNQGPNKILQKLNFELVDTLDTTPGWINFYQTVNKWCLSRNNYNIYY